MFKPLSIYIGLRYTRAKKRNHFISFISLASMLGISLGITVLITVLSVMNGFDHEIHNKIFSMARQVTITGDNSYVKHWKEFERFFDKNSEVIASAPYIDGQAMLSKDGQTRGVLVTGILPDQESKISKIQENIVQGSMSALEQKKFGIVLGYDIARHLHAVVGDKVVVITPRSTTTPIGVEPRFKRFTVVGIFHVGEGFGYDSTTAFINLHDAQKLFGFGDSVTGFHLKIEDLYRAPLVSSSLRNSIGESYFVSDWTHEYGSYFKAIQMEKTTMFVVLLFIIAVAAFNLVSSLVMTVTDKQSDIAILRTLGATPKMIMGVFIVQGSTIGLMGTLLGIVGGILLSINAPSLVVLLEQALHTQFISAGVYFIDYLPSKLEFFDVWRVALVTLFMSLVATVYPAWRASKTDPASALRYE